MKIRGTAAHIAEKYMSLARDALSSGDLVAAESYFQHAEHYNRIIQAAQSQLGAHNSHPGEGPNGGGFRPRWNAEGSDEEGGQDFDSTDGGGDVHDTRGGGGQDQERHSGDREHHGGGGHERGGQQRGGGRERGRQGGNGSEGTRDANGADQADAHQPDDAPDTTVS